MIVEGIRLRIIVDMMKCKVVSLQHELKPFTAIRHKTRLSSLAQG